MAIRAGTGARQGPVAATAAVEEVRERTLLSGPWRFSSAAPEAAGKAYFDDSRWTPVTVPHTWGKAPRRAAWYRTRFAITPEDAGRRLYVAFEGVAIHADVWVNGRHLGRHRGAFTRFVFDVTDHVAKGQNVLAVRANNHPADTVESLPSSAGRQLYHQYGGIYRKVWLVKTADVHVDPTDHAASGVFVTPTRVTPESARLAVRVLVRNASSSSRAVEVAVSLRDRDGREVATMAAPLTLAARSRAEARLETSVARPRLWSPGDPYLYSVVTDLREGGRVRDRTVERTGFRDFHMANGRFSLNGRPLLIRGVGKHQETEHRLSAVSDDDLREDFASLRDLGVNMVRLAHYPHAPLEYDLADEQGLLVWAENGHSNEVKVGEAGDVITREMVRQNYNHPSIVMWSVGNETGFMRVNRFAEIVRAEDPHRMIVYASNIGTRGKKRYPNLDLIAQNTYRGWYRGEPWDFEQAALSMRYISENGGGSVITHHDGYAAPRHLVDEFEPEEYRQVLEEVHDQVVFRDHAQDVPMYLTWIWRDFGTEKYKRVRNTKGLLTFAGFRKDAYYLYKSFLRPEEPVVHLASKTHFLRRGRPDDGLKAYSNRKHLTLVLNGAEQGSRANGEYRHPGGRRIDNVFFWAASLRPGRNDVTVTDGAGHADSAVIYHAGGDAGPGTPAPLITDLASSNPKSPAWFIDQPVREQWPFYYEFDGTADNTFDTLPEAVRGASWISTRRLSKPEARTELTFTVRKDASRMAVQVMATDGKVLGRALSAAGFADAGVTGRWRNDALQLVGWRLFRRVAAPGERVRVPAATGDYVVLVKKE